MNVDTGTFRAIVAERDQLRAEVADAGEIHGAVLSIAEAVLTFGDVAATRLRPVPPRRGQGRHTRPRGHLSVVRPGPG